MTILSRAEERSWKRTFHILGMVGFVSDSDGRSRLANCVRVKAQSASWSPKEST